MILIPVCLEGRNDHHARLPRQAPFGPHKETFRPSYVYSATPPAAREAGYRRRSGRRPGRAGTGEPQDDK